ncbi:cell adhesion molecule 2-like isoform X2 [Cololabis saira]|uniref:cell adhesion molecule 2-like isoform X2 n=1 Tax=Cololabis saira TaxID=129043 RepID=UPI002AD4A727|nr:cell adhesion molecule 2-like isoform X2 [Cololabis saira]
MNSTDVEHLTKSAGGHVSETPAVWSSLLPTPADTTVIPAPSTPDSAVIAVVIVLILLTVAALSFLLYRYLCHNKGDYRTTGELAPGEDPDEENSSREANEKKEYFI